MKRQIKRVRFYILLIVGILLVFVVVVNMVIHIATVSYIYSTTKNVPITETALIPGAAILNDGTLSPVFRDRVDLAIKLYEEKKVSKILVSGDNSTVSHNEVDPVRKYLLSKGIPDEDIFLDHAGFDTYSSMYRAHDIFGVASMTVTSQSFHLPRAVFIARRLGMEAYGVNADIGHILVVNYVREFLADEKAIVDLIIQRKPKYLGTKIPITGDGTEN